MTVDKQILDQLTFVYGPEVAASLLEPLKARLETFRQRYPEFSRSVDPTGRVTEADAMVITYGDQIREPDRPSLQSLAEVFEQQLKGVVSSIHILPFYPYSSDDGFSVIDYKAVDPELGQWTEIALFRNQFRLMVDAVINHISAESAWFQAFLKGDQKFSGYFISIDPAIDLSQVVRPRTSPLLTPVQTADRIHHVWTTFSPDQVDLNYKTPRLLLEIVDVLLFYVAQGADFIRLDAIGFMWKEVGTTCLHLPQAHRLIQMFRTILDSVAPHVLLITETNVPHKENISYFGDGRNEAQLVYQFSLAPLILHTFHTGDARVLQQWAAGLDELPPTATFFNFIASHDGIGIRPAEGLLTSAEIQNLVDKTLAHEGLVSYKTNPDGSQSAYELNITLFDALSDPTSSEPESLQIDRFIASQAIMLAMIGVPGIYVHSLFGSANDHIGVDETGRARSINRQKWLRSEVEAVLTNPNSRSNKVLQRYLNLLRARRAHRAFHPNGTQHIVGDDPALFCLLRTAPDGTERVLCLHNITDRSHSVEIDLSALSIPGELIDIVSREAVPVLGGHMLRLELAPYEVKWLVN